MATGSTEQLETSAQPSQPPAAERPTRKLLESLARLLFGAALFVLVLRWLAPNWSEVGERVELRFGWMLIGLLGTTLASVVTAARWQLLAELMGGDPKPYIVYFHGLAWTRLVGQFTSTLAADLLGRGYALRSAGAKQSLGHASMQVVLERMFDLVLPLILIGWALAARYDLLGTWVGAWPGLSLLVCALVFLALAIPLLRPSVRVALHVYLAVRLRLARWRRKQVEVEAMSPDAMPEVDARVAAKVAIHSVLRFAFVVLQFWAIAGAVGLEIGWVEMTTATPFAQLASMVGLAPGGLGMLELGWAGGLGFVGVDTLAISLFVLAQRAGVITFFAVLSLLSWPFARRVASS